MTNTFRVFRILQTTEITAKYEKENIGYNVQDKRAITSLSLTCKIYT